MVKNMIKCNRLFKIAGKRLYQGAYNIVASFAANKYRYNRKVIVLMKYPWTEPDLRSIVFGKISM